MVTSRVRLNNRTIANLLKSQGVADLVNRVAREVAAHAGEDADVDEYTTDRGAASVAVPAEQQAIEGALTRAAAAASLEVRQRP
ncbi:hypothetical protein [Nocardia farcinica]|uniref:Uncharacterized protein n=1 Tax=Nocardia farcinica (strain IFM 10152) TaxID=247156 RepID=Q5Z3V2_NOCFA|nr:hypothetical protein [Nocardia farcinica]BAD54889.1 hypothetical protein NFA_470 [Nocardia farcinica IFM 10152]